MFVTFKITKINKKALKNAFDLRPLYVALRQNHSQTSPDILKFYPDEKVDFSDKFRPLREEDYNRFISKRAARREPAATRQITSLAYKVGKQMISLAEGMPNEQVFPFTRLRLDTTDGEELLMEGEELAAALQYVPSQGLPSLLTELRQFQEELHRPPPLPRDVLVTNGGQHGIYQCVDLLVDPGDPVLVSEYTYTGIHSAFKPYHPEILGIPEDEHGIVPETIEAVLQDRLSRGLKMPKMMYLIPTGSNPTGTVIPEDRRRRIYELACIYDFLIVEDDPYMFLNYSDESIPSFLSLDGVGRVLRLDSLSKVAAAGLRAGWVSAPGPLLRRLELHHQAELLHPATIAQAITLRVLRSRTQLTRHLARTRQFYRRRRDVLHAALRAAGLPRLADWGLPSAGLFLWLRVRELDDVHNMVFQTAFQRGLMLVPGHAFQYDTSAPCPYVRLTFSKIREQDMEIAARHLFDIITDEQRQMSSKKSQRFATER